MLDPSPLTPRRLTLLCLTATTLLAMTHAPRAHAAACEVALQDGLGTTWNTKTFANFGVVGNGAFEGASALSIDADGAGPAGFGFYPSVRANDCLHEGGGNELRYPTRSVEGFDVTPTLYVSPDHPFGRAVTFVRNRS